VTLCRPAVVCDPDRFAYSNDGIDRSTSNRAPSGGGHHCDVLLCRDSDTETVIKLFHIRSRHLKRRIAKGDTALAARVRQSFKDEVDLAAGLRHPNIVDVLHRTEMPDGMPYFVMPYLPNSLAVKVWPLHMQFFVKTPVADRQIEPVSPVETVEMLKGLLSALSVVHEAGIVHRDVKPNNILMDAHGTPILCDFEAALLASGESVTWRKRFGAPPFVSPEQLTDPGSVGYPADVYSVGVIAYLMLTGRPPDASRAPPDRYLPGLDQQLNDLVMNLIEPAADRRLQDASVALALLNSCAGSLPASTSNLT